MARGTQCQLTWDPAKMIWLSDQSSAGVNKWGGTGQVKEMVLVHTPSKVLVF